MLHPRLGRDLQGQRGFALRHELQRRDGRRDDQLPLSGVVVPAPAAEGPGAAPRDAWLLGILILLFFLSGISGLVYQVLWLRLLGLVFGVTLYAASTVLATFMAGLAVGSFAAGQLVGRARRPLLWYGVAELLIALAALATPAGFQATEKLYLALHPGGSLLWSTVVRVLSSAALLLVPTAVMGATLPLVVKCWPAGTGVFGQRVSLVYAANTAGAIVGAVLTGFWLVGNLGIAASFRLAALINLVVAVVAVVTSSLSRAPAGLRAPPAGAAAAAPDRTRRLVLAVFAVSGFVSLGLEVVWFRILVLFVPATTYAFTVMLAAVLSGIAFGSALVAPILRRTRGHSVAGLAALELAIGLVAIFSLVVLPASYGRVVGTAGRLSRFVEADLATIAVLSLLIIFPASLLMGAAFPMGLRLWAADDMADAGRSTGRFTAVNLCGALLGALVSGFVLVPRLGTRGSLVLLAMASVASSLLLLSLEPAPAKRALGLGGTALAVAGALLASNPLAVALAYRYPNEKPLWNEEGLQTTVSVHERSDGVRALYLNGLPQAESSASTLQIHREIGHLPMLLHPRPARALVIGMGGGATVAAVASHEGVHVDLVELSEAVVRGSRWFSPANADLLGRPSLSLRIDDGRNHLLLTSERYDVITADVIRPDHAGSGNVYSVEYFRLARRALKDDGLMLQWIPRRSYLLVARTFMNVFPDATLWADGRLMVAGKHPLRISAEGFARKLQNADTRQALAAAGLESFPALLSRYAAGPAELRDFVGTGAILTDDRPLGEYYRSLPADDVPVDLSELLSRKARPPVDP